MRMNRSGRINVMLLVGIVVVVLACGLFFVAGDSPSSVAARFLQALSTGNAKAITDVSYMGDEPKADTLAQWQETMRLGQHYTFAWRIVGDTDLGPTSSSVNVMFTRNAASDRSYEESLPLPMIKVNGKWLVDVRSITRDFYPALPR